MWKVIVKCKRSGQEWVQTYRTMDEALFCVQNTNAEIIGWGWTA